jgi:hypothetical protein
MIRVRMENSELIHGDLSFISSEKGLLAFYRQTESSKFIFIHNLSDREVLIGDFIGKKDKVIYGKVNSNHDKTFISPKSVLWIKI